MESYSDNYKKAQEFLYMQERSESTTRIYREFILIVICILSLICLHQASADENPLKYDIEIPFLCIKLPLMGIIKFIPTLIFLSYLLVLASIERLIIFRRKQIIALYKLQNKYPTNSSLHRADIILRIEKAFLPGGIEIYPNVFNLQSLFSKILKGSAIASIGIIYNAFPYFISIYAITSLNKLEHQSIIIFLWNIVVLIIMLFCDMSVLFSTTRKNIMKLYETTNALTPPFLDNNAKAGKLDHI
jgi:hypothetical protein